MVPIFISFQIYIYIGLIPLKSIHKLESKFLMRKGHSNQRRVQVAIKNKLFYVNRDLIINHISLKIFPTVT